MLNLLTQKTVKDANSVTQYQQNINYDETGYVNASCPTGAQQHDDTGYPCTFTTRGLPTSITTYANAAAGTGGLTQHLAYDWFGNVIAATDPAGNTTSISYTDNYSDGLNHNTYALPTTVTRPTTNGNSHVTHISYYYNFALPYQVTDENNQLSTFSYDLIRRPAQENFPDGGQTTVTYNSPTSITTTTKINSSQNIVGTLLLDGLGRTKQSQLNSDPQGIDYTDTVYDALGRVASVSNPYRTTGDATYGVTSYQYDTLGRVTKVIPPDGSSSANNISASYASNTATVTDQAGKKRQSTIDSLGRLTQVTENPGGLGYVTTYSYDALSNLTSVMQNGGRQRTFVYDALSRLVCESNPEIHIATCPNPDNGSYTAGTIRYGYDNGGNLTSRQAPAPNQTGSATVTTTYSYDALHRLTQRSYNDGVTSAASFGYDESSIWGATLLNPIGRLTHTSVASTAYSAMSYDAVGRTLNQWQWTPTNWNTNVSGSFPVAYTYDLAGDTTSASNGMGVMISYAYDAAARPTIVTSSLVDAQHPATLATVDSTLGYYPHGALRKMTPGNGLTQTVAFNKALQPCRVNVNSSGTALAACADSIPSGNVQDFNYGFNAGSANNGNVASWTATGQQGFNRTFGYDALNRISTLNQSSGNSTGCSSTFNLSWTYDAWGNRTDQNVTGGTCNAFHATVNTQNRLSGSPYEYDAAGNMTHDASHTYFYDAENRLIQVDGTLGTCSTATACYQYDAFGLRAESNHGSWHMDYIHDLSGKVVADWETSSGFTGWATGYVYLNGALLAQYQGSTTHFAHPDHLGSTRLLTGLNQ